jgi:hypothetical protein
VLLTGADGAHVLLQEEKQGKSDHRQSGNGIELVAEVDERPDRERVGSGGQQEEDGLAQDAPALDAFLQGFGRGAVSAVDGEEKGDGDAVQDQELDADRPDVRMTKSVDDFVHER